VLARAGPHIAPTKVWRMVKAPRPPKPRLGSRAGGRVLTTRYPNYLWHVDLTTVPNALGFWIPWVPFARAKAWPFCWWVALAVDHFSRRVMGFALYRGGPFSEAIRRFLVGAFRGAGQQPWHIITDQDVQFTAKGFHR